MKWSPVILVLLLACGIERGSGYNKFLRPCNRVDMVVFNGGDTLYFDTRDTLGIQLLADQVTGNSDPYKDTCAADGYLRFMQDSTQLLQARFGAATGNCRFIAYHRDGYNFAHRLTDRAHRLLQTVLQQRGK